MGAEYSAIPGGPHAPESHIGQTATAAQLAALVGAGETALHSHPGGLVVVGSVEASDDATIQVAGIDTSVFEYLEVGFAGIAPATDLAELLLRFGDPTIDVGVADYEWGTEKFVSAWSNQFDQSDSSMQIGGFNDHGNAAGEGFNGKLHLYTGDLAMLTGGHWDGQMSNGAFSVRAVGHIMRKTNLTLTVIELRFSTGNVKNGRMTVWGKPHA